MLVDGTHYHTLWVAPEEEGALCVIDQRQLPWRFESLVLRDVQAVAHAIREMVVRGAGCIGVTAAYGMWLASREAMSSSDPLAALLQSAQILKQTRPTAVNLAWAVDRQLRAMSEVHSVKGRTLRAREEADRIAAEDLAACQSLGQHGLEILRRIAGEKPGAVVNILTHCNAGWLGFVDYGSATAPIYAAHAAGIPLHVWVDETRPRNQGARLTAWELGQQGVPHTVICDNVGGHLMQHGQVDLCITGADRVTRNGDVANKIGTYLKALAAYDNQVPFYVALPSSTIDWTLTDGVAQIPIETRDGAEVSHMEGVTDSGAIASFRVLPPSSPVVNYGFDVTPARLITGIITERGVATPAQLAALFGQ
jgi:methylthioribose-1-phosphate isomerase